MPLLSGSGVATGVATGVAKGVYRVSNKPSREQTRDIYYYGSHIVHIVYTYNAKTEVNHHYHWPVKLR